MEQPSKYCHSNMTSVDYTMFRLPINKYKERCYFCVSNSLEAVSNDFNDGYNIVNCLVKNNHHSIRLKSCFSNTEIRANFF